MGALVVVLLLGFGVFRGVGALLSGGDDGVADADGTQTSESAGDAGAEPIGSSIVVDVTDDSEPDDTQPVDTEPINTGPATAQNPATALIVGDSDAGTFGPYLQTLLDGTGVVETQLDYKVSSGLARPDFFDWPAEIDRKLPEVNPDIVVATFGGNDAQGLAVESGEFIVGDLIVRKLLVAEILVAEIFPAEFFLESDRAGRRWRRRLLTFSGRGLLRQEAIVIHAEFRPFKRRQGAVRVAQGGCEGGAEGRVHVELEIVFELVEFAVKLVVRSAHGVLPQSTAELMEPLASVLRSAPVFSPARYLVSTTERRAVSAGSIGWAPTRSDGLAIIAARFTDTAQPNEGSAAFE